MQMAEETLVTGEWVPVGFYIPGVFAGVIELCLQSGKSHRVAARALLKTQQEMHATCRGCGTEFSVTIWLQAEVLRLCRHAEMLSPTAFREMVETEHRQYVATCPSCGRNRHLSARTLQATD